VDITGQNDGVQKPGNKFGPKTAFLDTLGQASHPRRNPAFAQWFDRLLTTDTAVMIPEIADYEVRRELLRARREVGIRRLD
jgi:hypothetical protein